MVAAATSNLCEAANASVQGHASEEKLISSAKQVAASTAQLLVACKVKADQDSEAMRRLQVIVFINNVKIHLRAMQQSPSRLFNKSKIQQIASGNCLKKSRLSSLLQ